MILALVFLILFVTIASTDGFYFHIYKYRLHQRPASWREHLLHTINVCLFVPQVALMFFAQPHGLYLWLVVLLALVILGVELLDVVSENDSRRDLGGLTSTEYAMHFMMSGLRMGFVAAWFVATPSSEFFAPTALTLAPTPIWIAGMWMAGTGVIAAGIHVVLAVTGRRRIAEHVAVRGAVSAASG